MSDLLLLSGGLDSAAVAFWLRPAAALTVDYGQRTAEAELWAAQAVASQLAIEHHTRRLPIADLGAGEMRDDRAPSAALKDIAATPEWWPYRNLWLATLAASVALGLGHTRVLIGTVAGDSVHKDGAPEFISLLNELISYQEGQIQVVAPALHLSGVQLLNRSRIPREIVGWTHSCHVAKFPCGQCRGCKKRTEDLADYDYTSTD